MKATYLLAVAYLEMLRLSRFGGVLPPDLQRQGSAGGDPPGTSWLACTFKYLEAPNLTDQVRRHFLILRVGYFVAFVTSVPS